jgi:hypothetical protein
MNAFRFSKLLTVVLLFALVACQAPVTPTVPTAAPAATLAAAPAAPTSAPAQAQTTLASKIFKLPMTARYGTEWSIQDEYADVVTLVGPAELAFIIVKDVKIADPMASFSKVAFPDDFVGWIKSHGLFPTLDTHPVVVGGLKGIEINTQVTADCGTKKDWLFLAQTGWNCRKGEYYHFILLNDVYGQRVLIMNTGGDDFSAEHFKAQVAASQQVLDTVVFSKP